MGTYQEDKIMHGLSVHKVDVICFGNEMCLATHIYQMIFYQIIETMYMQHLKTVHLREKILFAWEINEKHKLYFRHKLTTICMV